MWTDFVLLGVLGALLGILCGLVRTKYGPQEYLVLCIVSSIAQLKVSQKQAGQFDLWFWSYYATSVAVFVIAFIITMTVLAKHTR